MLGLLWNVFDDRVPWVADLVAASAAEDRLSAMDDELPYDGEPVPERREFAHRQARMRALLVDNLASCSGTVLMAPAAREDLLRRVRDLAPAEAFELPWMCDTWRAQVPGFRLRPAPQTVRRRRRRLRPSRPCGATARTVEIVFAAVYRWRLKPGKEDQFLDGWERVTRSIRRSCGSYGSRLHQCSDGTWLAYARWPDAATRDACEYEEPEGRRLMRDAVAEDFDNLLCTIVSDLLAEPGRLDAP